MPGIAESGKAGPSDDGELYRLRAQVSRLERAANRPIDSVIASYEVIRTRHADAGAGDTRRTK
jgi:hypothetical protein